MYSESLGRWKTADLLIGLAYLARQGANCAVADIACAGKLVGEGKDKKERCAIVVRNLSMTLEAMLVPLQCLKTVARAASIMVLEDSSFFLFAKGEWTKYHQGDTLDVLSWMFL